MSSWQKMQESIESQICDRGFARLSDVCQATGISRQRAHQIVKEKAFSDAAYEYKGKGAIVRSGGTVDPDAFNTHTSLRNKSVAKIRECAEAIMALEFPTPRVRKNWLEEQLPQFSYHYVVAAVDLLVEEGRLRRTSYRNTGASPVMKLDDPSVSLGGYFPDPSTDIGKIRSYMMDKKVNKESFFAYEPVRLLGVNSGLVMFEVKRLLNIGEIVKIGTVDKDDNGRKLPSPRQLYRFV
jgi:hypothetical protein